jgi:hypothetical protein
VHFLGSLPEHAAVESHSWELVASGHAGAPFWWCHGWALVDVTMRPERLFTVADARRTLQGLALWPSAQLAVRPVPLGPGPAAAPRPPAPAAEGRGAHDACGGGYTAAPRPSAAAVLQSVVGRATKGAASAGGREHYSVQASAAAAAEARVAAAKPAAQPPSRRAATPAAQPVEKPAAKPEPTGFQGWGTAASAAAPTSAAAAALPAPGAPAATTPAASTSSALAELVAMGFDAAAARHALDAAGGSQERAVEILLR